MAFITTSTHTQFENGFYYITVIENYGKRDTLDCRAFFRLTPNKKAITLKKIKKPYLLLCYSTNFFQIKYLTSFPNIAICEKHQQKYHQHTVCFVLGRGFSYPIKLEGYGKNDQWNEFLRVITSWSECRLHVFLFWLGNVWNSMRVIYNYNTYIFMI